MARLARLTAPEVAHHVVVQGINRESIFIDNSDRSAWLGFLQVHALAARVRVHAYVMLRDHIQILVTPEPEGDVSRMMQGIGRQYVSAFNRKHGRTGTLWDGRYRCSLVQSDQHLLRSMAFMDLTPVRLGEVGAVGAHIWGSYGHYTGSQPETWLYTPAPVWALGNTPFAREAAYQTLVDRGLSAVETADIAAHVWRGWAMGDAAFLADLAQTTQRRVQKARPGRPKKVRQKVDMSPIK